MHLISWDEEPNMKNPDGTPKAEALPDFVVTMNLTTKKDGFRKSIETFEEPK